MRGVSVPEIMPPDGTKVAPTQEFYKGMGERARL
jgi:hypothetical protein